MSSRAVGLEEDDPREGLPTSEHLSSLILRYLMLRMIESAPHLGELLAVESDPAKCELLIQTEIDRACAMAERAITAGPTH